MSFDFSNTQGGEEMPWDLRQFYVQWIAAHMRDYYEAQSSNNYPLMLKKVKEWHSAIWGRSIKNLDLKNLEDDNFNSLYRNIVDASHKHKETYLARKRDERGIYDLEQAFYHMKIYLIFLMKKNKMFGSESSNRSLS